MANDSTNIPPQCPGVGGHAVLEPRTGFYGCPICKAPQGVILRAGGYLVPGHEFGSIHREPGDPTFVIRTPEHSNSPLLNLAAQHGLPKDMVIDLLCQGFMRLQASMQQQATAKKPEPKIILTGHGGES